MEKSFSVCSVEAVFACQETDCVIVTGHVKGIVSAGIEVRVMNFGDDGCEEYLARILSLEIGRSSVPSATDCEVGIKLTGISMDKISEGCVISAGKAASEYLLWAFAMGLAYEYVERRDMDLTEEEWEMLPIGHLAEIASVYMAAPTSKKIFPLPSGLSEPEASFFFEKMFFRCFYDLPFLGKHRFSFKMIFFDAFERGSYYLKHRKIRIHAIYDAFPFSLYRSTEEKASKNPEI